MLTEALALPVLVPLALKLRLSVARALMLGRNADSACGTASSVARWLARAALSVGLFEYAETIASSSDSAARAGAHSMVAVARDAATTKMSVRTGTPPWRAQKTQQNQEQQRADCSASPRRSNRQSVYEA